MTKSSKGNRCGIASRHSRLKPYPMLTGNETGIAEDNNLPKASEKKDWEDATCSVCMESPHNAVLLLCSSHENGCRPYMCGTSFRFSNCLDQYKAHTKVIGPFLLRSSLENIPESPQLSCPLCRGRVKGWTVVDPARAHLNDKKRSCTHDNCSFIGSYKELRKHVRADHPSSKPREVDPALEQEWRRLEVERETEDVRSTVRSSVPGAVFRGDYVIEGGGPYGGNEFYWEDEAVFDWNAARGDRSMDVTDESLMAMVRVIRAFGSAGRGVRPIDDGDDDDEEEEVDVHDMTLAGRMHRQGRVMSGHSWRRRRRRR